METLLRIAQEDQKRAMRRAGLKQDIIELDEGQTKLHFWSTDIAAAKCPLNNDNNKLNPNLENAKAKSKKPILVLLHGFGSNGTEGWAKLVRKLSAHFWLFIPDLLFFGESTTRVSPDDRRFEEIHGARSEFFQAHCVYRALSKLLSSDTHFSKVLEFDVVGHSYGGFVGFRMAHLYPESVRRLVVVSSGVCMDSHSNDDVIRKFMQAPRGGAGFCNDDVGCTIHDVLVPRTPQAVKRALELVLNTSLSWVPSFVFAPLLKNIDRVQRLELIDGIVLGKENAPDLPMISQATLILWGDKDQIFNIDLAHKLKRLLGDNARIKVFQGYGHVPHGAKGFVEEIMQFLLEGQVDHEAKL